MAKVISFKLDNTYLDKLTNDYKDYELDNPNPYLLHFYKLGDLTISLYKSMSIVISGEKASEIACNYGYKEKEWLINSTHAGSDEVGTGDSFGPIVVVASLVKDSEIEYLEKLGVNDSKKLSDKFIFSSLTTSSILIRFSFR